MFNLPRGEQGDPEASDLRQTIRMQNFQQAPQGFWYPTLVHNTSPGIPRNDQPLKTTARYHFDFDANLPDALFTIDDAQHSK